MTYTKPEIIATTDDVIMMGGNVNCGGSKKASTC